MLRNQRPRRVGVLDVVRRRHHDAAAHAQRQPDVHDAAVCGPGQHTYSDAKLFESLLDCMPHDVLQQDTKLKASSPKMKGIVWKNMEPAGMGAVQVR